MSGNNRVLVALALSVVAPASAQTAVDRSNLDFQTLWQNDGLPLVRSGIDDALRPLSGTSYPAGPLQVDIVGSPRYALDMAQAPGFTRMNDQGVSLRVPLSGAWRIEVETEVRVHGRLLFLRIDKRIQIRGEVRDLVARLEADIDSTQPDHPILRRVQPPQVDFNVGLSTNKWYLNLLLYFFRHKLGTLAHDAVDTALAGLTPTLTQLQGQPVLFGTGGAPTVPGVQTRLTLEQAALKIHERITRFCLPYGSLAEPVFDNVYTGTWEDSFTDPNFTPGTPLSYEGLGDSAMWTGNYLAACAFRAAVTGDTAAKREAEAMVDSFGLMLNLRGAPGFLNRAILPVAANPAAANWPGNYVSTYQGTDYVCWDSISRDQYVGVLLSMGAVYDLVPDLRAKVRQRVEQALDYILANNWTTRLRDGSVDTFWLMAHSQQLAWLRLGHRVNPGKYAAKLAEYLPVAEVMWLGAWISTTDQHNSYYKYNLSHETLYTLLRLETDPNRWQEEARSLRMLRNLIGHHQNAHFQVIYAAHDPSLRPAVRGEVTDMLGHWLKRPRRHRVHDLSNDPTIDKVQFPGALTGGSGGLVAKHPLPIELRETTDFLWQRSPFGLRSGGHDGKQESPGADFILPYWMGRYFGVVR